MNFVKSVRRIKLKEKVWKFEVGCENNKEVLMVWNERGLKNLKLKQQDATQVVDEPKPPKPAEVARPKKVLQRESKAVKPASEPSAANSGIFGQQEQGKINQSSTSVPGVFSQIKTSSTPEPVKPEIVVDDWTSDDWTNSAPHKNTPDQPKPLQIEDWTSSEKIESPPQPPPYNPFLTAFAKK